MQTTTDRGLEDSYHLLVLMNAYDNGKPISYDVFSEELKNQILLYIPEEELTRLQNWYDDDAPDMSMDVLDQIRNNIIAGMACKYGESLDYAKKLDALQKEYETYLQKQADGGYLKEYEALLKENPDVYMYGDSVFHRYTADINGEYMVDARYNNHGTIALRELGYKFDFEGYELQGMSMEEYVNLMGPVWELSQNHETFADDMEDIRICLTVLSSLAAGVTLAGIGIPFLVDAGFDVTEAGISFIAGDRVGGFVALAGLLLPEIAEQFVKFKRFKKVGNVADDANKLTTIVTKYSDDKLSDLLSFNSSIDNVLSDNGLTLQKFDELKLTKADSLIETDIKTMKNIRDIVPVPTSETLIQKVIPESDVFKYLNGEYTTGGGYVAKMGDVKDINKYDDVVESLRLDYTVDGYRPFPDGGDSYHVIRFKTDDLSIKNIPYSNEFGGTTFATEPFTGNGFTASRNGTIVPEWKPSYVKPSYGEIYKITDGSKPELIGVFDAHSEKFIKAISE